MIRDQLTLRERWDWVKEQETFGRRCTRMNADLQKASRVSLP